MSEPPSPLARADAGDSVAQHWLQRAWRGEASALPVFAWLVAMPWIAAVVSGNTSGYANILFSSYNLQPQIFIPLWLLELILMLLGVVAYWRCAFNHSLRWAAYVGCSLAAIRGIELASRVYLAVSIVYALLPQQ